MSMRIRRHYTPSVPVYRSRGLPVLALVAPGGQRSLVTSRGCHDALWAVAAALRGRDVVVVVEEKRLQLDYRQQVRPYVQWLAPTAR